MSYVIKAVLSNPRRPECGQITIPFPIPADQYDQTIEMLQEMDNVLGAITNEQFRMLSTSYNTEQKILEETIPEKEVRLEKLKASVSNVENFIEKAKRYTAIEELTPELLRLFIQRIEVGERSKKGARTASQNIYIVYRDIGAVDSMMLEGEAKPYIKPPVILTGEVTVDGIPA